MNNFPFLHHFLAAQSHKTFNHSAFIRETKTSSSLTGNRHPSTGEYMTSKHPHMEWTWGLRPNPPLTTTFISNALSSLFHPIFFFNKERRNPAAAFSMSISSFLLNILPFCLLMTFLKHGFNYKFCLDELQYI